MTLAESFVALFDSTNMLTTCLWLTGLALFCIEYFQPVRGALYALGLGLIGTAFVTRIIYGSPGEAFMFVLLTSIVMFAVHVASLITNRRDWLRVARIEKVGARRRKYDTLIDSIGVANTPIDLTGNVTINDVNLVVYSETPIKQGEEVRITKITSDRIVVERINKTSDFDEA